MRLPRRSLQSAAVAALLSAAPVPADSPCEGLEQFRCAGKSGCTEVDGFTRQDGVKVSRHCKRIGQAGGSAATGKEPEKKSASAAKEKDTETKPSAKEMPLDKTSGTKEKETEKTTTAKDKPSEKQGSRDRTE